LSQTLFITKFEFAPKSKLFWISLHCPLVSRAAGH